MCFILMIKTNIFINVTQSSFVLMGCVRSHQKKVPVQLGHTKIRTAVFDPIRYVKIAFIVDKKTLCVKSMNRVIASYLADSNSTSYVENREYSGLIVDRDTHALIRVSREKKRFEGGCGRMYSRFEFGHIFIFLYEMTDMSNVSYARKELDALKFDIKCITPVLMIGYRFNVFCAWQKECPLFCGRTDLACVFSTLCRDVLYHIASYLFLLHAPC